MLFHKVRKVISNNNYELTVIFAEGITKKYDVKPLIKKIKIFEELKDKILFNKAQVAQGGYGVIFNSKIDISCDELYKNGVRIITPFDNLMSFKEATDLWELNESTLRKALTYGKFKEGIDVCKFGKQWVINVDSMIREYGELKD